MKHIQTRGIILTRTDFREADRIITVLTKDKGKIGLIAKGVRKSTSKLAGGIELFSSSHLTYIEGRGDIHTLTSARLDTHYGHIVEDVHRTMAGYDILKHIHRSTEQATDEDYYTLLVAALEGLNDERLELPLLRGWYDAQSIKMSGHQPDLFSDAQGTQLRVDDRYMFDSGKMAFQPTKQGIYTADHIKLLRLLFGYKTPNPLRHVKNAPRLIDECARILRAVIQSI